MNGVRSRFFVLSALVGVAMALGACATKPPYYGPKTGSTGYTDERLGENRYRITYSGGFTANRQKVEDYLLLRSAEVTLKAGFSHFEFDTRDTKARTTYYSAFNGWPGWRGYGWYWHSWAYDDREQESTRYEAYAEIVMLTADQAKSEPRSLNAQEIADRIGPRTAPPPAH